MLQAPEYPPAVWVFPRCHQSLPHSRVCAPGSCLQRTSEAVQVRRAENCYGECLSAPQTRPSPPHLLRTFSERGHLELQLGGSFCSGGLIGPNAGRGKINHCTVCIDTIRYQVECWGWFVFRAVFLWECIPIVAFKNNYLLKKNVLQNNCEVQTCFLLLIIHT